MDTTFSTELKGIMGCAYIDEYITALEHKTVQINSCWEKDFKLLNKEANANYL